MMVARTGTPRRASAARRPHPSSRPARARRLVADEEHGGLRVGQRALQVVEDAAAGGHAAARDDDAGAGRVVQALRLLDRARERKRRGAKGACRPPRAARAASCSSVCGA